MQTLFANTICVCLLLVWLFKECTDVHTSFTTIFFDFVTLITCFYSTIRVIESKNGNFHVLDMITLYYCNLFLLFSWFSKFMYLLWDFLWVDPTYTLPLCTTFAVFLGLMLNFYATEDQNMKNLDKIEAEI